MSDEDDLVARIRGVRRGGAGKARKPPICIGHRVRYKLVGKPYLDEVHDGRIGVVHRFDDSRNACVIFDYNEDDNYWCRKRDLTIVGGFAMEPGVEVEAVRQSSSYPCMTNARGRVVSVSDSVVRFVGDDSSHAAPVWCLEKPKSPVKGRIGEDGVLERFRGLNSECPSCGGNRTVLSDGSLYCEECDIDPARDAGGIGHPGYRWCSSEPP